MKIQYLGFLPFIVIYFLSTYITWLRWIEGDKYFAPTAYRIMFVLGTIIVMIGGIMWGFIG